MLNRFDDYPIHQTTAPVLHVETASPNAYNRYFFNGYRRDGSLMFGAALGIYPNRGVIDAGLSVLRNGEQVSTLASGRAPLDPTRTEVGHLRVDVIEPMRTLRFRCDADRSPLGADLVFHGRTAAVEEPPFKLEQDGRTVLDYTRVTQFGSWEGWLSVDGERMEVDATVLGCRDRSWGVRPIGERAGRGAPSRRAPQFFWLWAPLNFDGCGVLFDVNEFADGRRWHGFGAIAPVLLDGMAALGEADDGTAGVAESLRQAAQDAVLEPPIPMRDAQYVIDWEPGTRRSAMASIILEPFGGIDTHIIRLEPLATFHMSGLGYGHPEWGHGCWRGEQASVDWRWRTEDIDPSASSSIHVQQLVRARWGSQTGIGVLEQLVIGNHGPTGLSGVFDGAP